MRIAGTKCWPIALANVVWMARHLQFQGGHWCNGTREEAAGFKVKQSGHIIQRLSTSFPRLPCLERMCARVSSNPSLWNLQNQWPVSWIIKKISTCSFKPLHFHTIHHHTIPYRLFHTLRTMVLGSEKSPSPLRNDQFRYTPYGFKIC